MSKEVDVSAKAMLVKMSIGQWYNRAIDRKVTMEIAAKYELKGSEDQYVKKLIPHGALSSIEKAITALRKYHNDNTLPWGQDGVRILPGKKYLQYVQDVAMLKQQFEQTVAAFIGQFDNWVENAKLTKKDLFNPGDYPSKENLAKMFYVKLDFFPLPNANDFRLDLHAQDLAELRRSTEASIRDAYTDANRSLVQRVAQKLQACVAAIQVPGKIFRDATVTSIIETVSLVEDLNVTNNEDVTLVCGATRTACGGPDFTPEALRTNESYRLRKTKELAALLEVFAPFM